MSGIPRDMLVPRDFVMLHLDLLDLLPSLESAVLLLRIQYRAGDGWWEVTKSEMQAECRLSERKLDRALRELIDGGFIEWERIGSASAKRRCRVRYEETSGTKRPDLRDETSRTSSIERTKTPPLPPQGGAARKLTRAQEEEFARWWALYPKKVGKDAARREYAKALRTEDPSCLLAGLTAQVTVLTAKKAEGYCPDPRTWLSHGRWNDEVTPLLDRDAPRQPGESIPDYRRRLGYE